MCDAYRMTGSMAAALRGGWKIITSPAINHYSDGHDHLVRYHANRVFV